jgi:predicted lipoprotein with Yx(FWY)xxD motif
MVLTDPKGFTLYYFMPDTATTVACPVGCASPWPPLIFTGTGPPTAASTRPGQLAVLAGGNFFFFYYECNEIYTFKGDTAAGQANGEGVAGKWHAVTPDVAPLT